MTSSGSPERKFRYLVTSVDGKRRSVLLSTSELDRALNAPDSWLLSEDETYVAVRHVVAIRPNDGPGFASL